MRELNDMELNTIAGGMGPIDLTPIIGGFIGLGVIGGLILAGVGYGAYQLYSSYKLVHV
jgi:hypothetical protein